MCATLYSNVCYTRLVSEEVKFHSMFRSVNGYLNLIELSQIMISLGVIELYKALSVGIMVTWLASVQG